MPPHMSSHMTHIAIHTFLWRQFYWWTCITGEKSRLEEWNLRISTNKSLSDKWLPRLQLNFDWKTMCSKSYWNFKFNISIQAEFRWILKRFKLIRYHFHLNCQSQMLVKLLDLHSLKPSLSPLLQRRRFTQSSSSPSGQLPLISTWCPCLLSFCVIMNFVKTVVINWERASS